MIAAELSRVHGAQLRRRAGHRLAVFRANFTRNATIAEAFVVAVPRPALDGPHQGPSSHALPPQNRPKKCSGSTVARPPELQFRPFFFVQFYNVASRRGVPHTNEYGQNTLEKPHFLRNVCRNCEFHEPEQCGLRYGRFFRNDPLYRSAHAGKRGSASLKRRAASWRCPHWRMACG